MQRTLSINGVLTKGKSKIRFVADRSPEMMVAMLAIFKVWSCVCAHDPTIHNKDFGYVVSDRGSSHFDFTAIPVEHQSVDKAKGLAPSIVIKLLIINSFIDPGLLH
ncbi:hypothetical protein KCP69_26725 (plasmid) [Salmonella enterica subsp. enterica]|nr:hypothetical protein KCP69_26725 [Salmonella enterica subsp. enterica]